MFKTDRYQEFSFSEWLAHTPSELVRAHPIIDKASFDAIPKNGVSVKPL
jgi:oxalate decarboxylase